ncbi:MAG: NYN domain-containing protein [Candidatus Staskawiczbacteria bacterium]|nr:NYN domain-containing protein [Candidatus Staskawiczbacteria bacterium]
MESPQNIKKVKIYIDGANIFYTQKRLGWFIDWAKVKNLVEAEKEVFEWKYYVGAKDGDEKMLKYLRHLNHIGFNVTTKPLKKIKVSKDEIFPQTEKGGFIYKANFDVEMTADILLDKSKLDEIIIFSGDSDFKYLVKKLKDAGVKTIVYSSRKTISWELKLESSKIVYFEDIKDKILKQ